MITIEKVGIEVDWDLDPRTIKLYKPGSSARKSSSCAQTR